MERGVRGLKARSHTFPINHAVQERIHVIRTAVAVVDVVGVFPYIAAEQRFLAAEAKWVHAVWRGGHFKLAIVFNEPSPAGAELACAFGDKSCFEVCDGAEIRDDTAFQLARHIAAAIFFHAFPEQDVVPVLGCVVEYASFISHVVGLLHNVFEGHGRHVRTVDEIVQVRDIGLVVFVVVKLECLLRHVRAKRIVSVRQGWKFKSHCIPRGLFVVKIGTRELRLALYLRPGLNPVEGRT